MHVLHCSAHFWHYAILNTDSMIKLLYQILKSQSFKS